MVIIRAVAAIGRTGAARLAGLGGCRGGAALEVALLPSAVPASPVHPNEPPVRNRQRSPTRAITPTVALRPATDEGEAGVAIVAEGLVEGAAVAAVACKAKRMVRRSFYKFSFYLIITISNPFIS